MPESRYQAYRSADSTSTTPSGSGGLFCPALSGTRFTPTSSTVISFVVFFHCYILGATFLFILNSQSVQN